MSAPPFPSSAIPAIALCCSDAEAAGWEASLRLELPQARIGLWPAVVPGAESAIVGSANQDFIDAHPKLRHVFAMAAGVDALMRLRFAAQTRVVRLEDAGMAVQMADYVCHAVLRHVREFDVYAASASAGAWTPRPARDRRDFPVGVMGLGVLGARVAKALVDFDFPVLGWSRSPKRIDGVECLAGADRLDAFLARTRVLVCLLPLTDATRDVLCHASLSRLKPGGYLINVARGAHLVEADLLRLLDSGHLDGATLDVTRDEPLPADHPFQQRAEIVLTPHIAAQTLAHAAMVQIAAKIRADGDGKPVTGVVDRASGY